MYYKIREENENHFAWGSIDNISEGRKNLGETMPVLIYRLLLFTMKDELYKQFGNEKAIEIFRNAGELAGSEFAKHMLNLEVPFNDFVNQLWCNLAENKIGILRLEEFDLKSGKAILTVGEGLDCLGSPVTGETVCDYDEGFLAGILKEYTYKEYVVTEVDCWATGSRVCRFFALVKEGKK